MFRKLIAWFLLLIFFCCFKSGCGQTEDKVLAQNFIIYTISRFTGGLDLKHDSAILPSGIQIENAIEARNCDFRDGNSIQSRDGFAKLIDNTYNKSVTGIFPFYIGVTRHLLLLTFSYISMPGTTTLDSTVVLINDTSDFYVGQYVDFSLFFPPGPHKITSISDNSYIVVEVEATGSGETIVSTPYPVEGGLSYSIYDSTALRYNGTASAVYFNPAVYNDLCYITHYGNVEGEDFNLKYDGTIMTQCGIDAPVDQLSGEPEGAITGLFSGTTTGGRLFRWNDFALWIEKAPLLGTNITIYALVALGNYYYAGSSVGRLLRWDNSSLWEQVAAKLICPAIQCLCIMGSEIYGSGGYGYLQKWDGVSLWESVAQQLNSEHIRSLCVFDSGSGDHIYGGTYYTGRLYEWNGSNAWVQVAPQLSSQQIVSSMVVYDSGSGDNLYGVTMGSTSGHLFEWNKTSAWVSKGSIGDYLNSVVVFDDGSGDDLYAAGNDGKLYIWNDVDTLTSVTTVPAPSEIKCLISHDSNLYAGTVTGELLVWNKTDAWVEKVPQLDSQGIYSLLSQAEPLNLDGSYYYYYTFFDSVIGHESALSPISSVIETSDQKITLSNIAVSSDSSVDKKKIYRTGGTLSTINFIAEIDNDATTYTDNLADTSVGLPEEVSTNKVLAAVKAFAIHHHQLFAGFSDGEDGYVYDSRFYLPVAFPDSYYFKIGNASDPIIRVVPLEIDLIVYTLHHTYRLRYIGANEGDVVMEEIAAVGLASDNTLAVGTDSSGKQFHIFLGQSSRGRGIYVHSIAGIVMISTIIDPIFTGERSDVTAMNWNYVDICNGCFSGNKYYLAYPEDGETTPNKVLVADFSFSSPVFMIYDLDALAMTYDPVTDQTIFGGTAKEVYYFAGTADWLSSAVADIDLVYQTPYFGDRNNDGQIKELRFNADTQDDILTVKVYADYSLVQTLTCSTSSMERVVLPTNPIVCIGKMFSIRFEISSMSRIKISPPLEVQVIPYKKY